MKKVLTICLAVMLLASVLSLSVLARDEEIPYAYVTIVDENGKPALIAKEIPCPDGITVDKMLEIAHEMYFSGGIEAGYASEISRFGISLVKFWGNESGAYGYYLNDQLLPSLADEIKPGDHLYAFIYTDTVNYSDTYAFFQETHKIAKKGDIATLTLTTTGFDENWNIVSSPIEGAIITIDGEKTDLVTDENGQVAITFDKAGEFIVSAVHDERNLTPPVMLASVEGGIPVSYIVMIVSAIAIFAVTLVVAVKKKR